MEQKRETSQKKEAKALAELLKIYSGMLRRACMKGKYDVPWENGDER